MSSGSDDIRSSEGGGEEVARRGDRSASRAAAPAGPALAPIEQRVKLASEAIATFIASHSGSARDRGAELLLQYTTTIGAAIEAEWRARCRELMRALDDVDAANREKSNRYNRESHSRRLHAAHGRLAKIKRECGL